MVRRVAGYGDTQEENQMKMRLWKRASALLKDKNSVYLARFSRKAAFRNPKIEEAVIKSTSHDERSVDYKNAQCIFTLIRTSPRFLKPVIWSLSIRMGKTRNWVVALKGLMLMHGILCCNVSPVRRIGRLPFDFGDFRDGYSSSTRTLGLNAFIRAYFAALDQKSVLASAEEDAEKNSTMEVLRKLQCFLDMLLQLKPYNDIWNDVLVLEAMDCIVIEIFDLYSKICDGVAGVLVRIYVASEVEAEMALHVVHKAMSQGYELDSYLEFCRDIGVLNASEFPRVEKIPEEDIQDLERIISGVSKKMSSPANSEKEETSPKMETLEVDGTKKLLRSITTENWVVFDDEIKVSEPERCVNIGNTKYTDPFFSASQQYCVDEGSSVYRRG